jgi:hypothetical protein
MLSGIMLYVAMLRVIRLGMNDVILSVIIEQVF